jgi:hypothetical protein
MVWSLILKQNYPKDLKCHTKLILKVAIFAPRNFLPRQD